MEEIANKSKLEKDLQQDSFRSRIHDEVEEFLQDLTLEYAFQEIFDSLRRFEFKDRFGNKVVPLPKKPLNLKKTAEPGIDERIESFLMHLEDEFGEKYSLAIQESFRFFTATTFE